MFSLDTTTQPASGDLPLPTAADLQDDLLVASNDLDRLQRLLDDASHSLLRHFMAARLHIETAIQGSATAPTGGRVPMHGALKSLGSAVTALQFHDMATQLLAHTTQRLRSCADRVARDSMGEDDDGAALVEDAPERPNPVTQDEMDTGYIELF